MTDQKDEKGCSKFRNMFDNFNDRPLEEITKHLDRLGITIAFIAGAAAVAKYSDKILPSCPLVVKIAGVALVFVGIFLIVWVGCGAWVGLAKFEPSRIRYCVGGFLFFLIAILVGLGGMFAALAL